MLIFMAAALQVSVFGITDDTEGCTDKEGTIALSSCYSERAEIYDKRMRAAYPVALHFAHGDQRKALVRSQQAWLKYRDAECEFYNLEQGTIHFIQSAYCMLDLTRRRALELEQYPLP
ncbi:MAG: lysozyme inhibitor LprI family protein [Sphingomicrobium sp.]